MSAWMQFLAVLAGPLFDLFEHVVLNGRPSDPETEKQLAMAIVRAAHDAKAREEFR